MWLNTYIVTCTAVSMQQLETIWQYHHVRAYHINYNKTIVTSESEGQFEIQESQNVAPPLPIFSLRCSVKLFVYQNVFILFSADTKTYKYCIILYIFVWHRTPPKMRPALRFEAWSLYV
jgi:hypothetical protein